MGEVWKNHLISLCRGNCDYAPAGFTAASDADRAGDVRRKHEAPDSSVTHGTRDGSQAGSWLSNQDGRRATGLFQRRGKQDKIPCFGLTGASGRAARLRGGGGAQRQESQSPALTEKVALAWEAAEGRAAPQRRAVGWPRRVVRASGTGLRRFRGGQLSLEAPPCRGREAPVVKAHPANTHTEQQTSFPTS